MKFNDAILGVVLVVFAITEIVYSTTFPTLHGQAYGPSLFPTIIGFALCACGIVLIVRGLKARQINAKASPFNKIESDSNLESDNKVVVTQWVQPGAWADDLATRINMALVPGLLIIYIATADTIGFIPLSILILSILLYRLGSTLIVSIAISIATTVVLQLLFAKMLLVPLPSGLLLRWLG